MRILHVVPTYLPATRYGGPIVSVHGLAKALARRGNEVDVFTTNVDGDGDSAVPLQTAVPLDGVNVHYFASTFRRVYRSPGMRAALQASVGNYDVVHLHSVYLWPTFAAARLAQQRGIPYVISPRGMLVPELIARRNRLIKTVWLELIERRNFAHAAAVHFTSQQEWDDAKQVALPLPSPFVIPNGVDVPPLADVPRDPNLVLFLGRIHWKKGLDRLIAAMQQLPDARLVIAGGDEEGLAATLPKDPRVTFAGEVHGPAKDELLQRASLLVLPSLNENFGNVVLEALAAETPVVVTRGVGLAETVANADAGIISDDDPRALADAIGALLADRERARAMGRRGRELVAASFSWDRVAAEMEAAYRGAAWSSATSPRSS